MALTKSWASSVHVAFITLLITASGLWGQEEASLPASQEKRVLFNRPELPRLFVGPKRPAACGEKSRLDASSQERDQRGRRRAGRTLTLRIFQPVQLAPQGFIRLLFHHWLSVLMGALRAGFVCAPKPSDGALAE